MVIERIFYVDGSRSHNPEACAQILRGTSGGVPNLIRERHDGSKQITVEDWFIAPGATIPYMIWRTVRHGAQGEPATVVKS